MGELKMQTLLRAAGAMQRELAETDDLRTRAILQRAIQAAEWYAGYLLLKNSKWSMGRIADAGFPLEPAHHRVKTTDALAEAQPFPPAGG